MTDDLAALQRVQHEIEALIVRCADDGLASGRLVPHPGDPEARLVDATPYDLVGAHPVASPSEVLGRIRVAIGLADHASAADVADAVEASVARVRDDPYGVVLDTLRRHPDVYLRVVTEARVVLPWSEQRAEPGRRPSWQRDPASGDEDAGGYVWDSVEDGGWRGCVGTTDLMHGEDADLPMVWATAEEARAAVDAALADAGWTLAGEP